MGIFALIGLLNIFPPYYEIITVLFELKIFLQSVNFFQPPGGFTRATIYNKLVTGGVFPVESLFYSVSFDRERKFCGDEISSASVRQSSGPTACDWDRTKKIPQSLAVLQFCVHDWDKMRGYDVILLTPCN